MASPASSPSATERAPLLDPERGAPPLAEERKNRAYRRLATGKTVAAMLGAIALGLGVTLIAQRSGLLQDGGARPPPPPPPHGRPPARRKNVIMMVSDGFGPASETFGRTMYFALGLGSNSTHDGSGDSRDWWGPRTPLDELLVGQSRTRSSNSWVTDSAAGATAFSCAHKSYNGAIGVTAEQMPCATVFEAAKLVGYKTGLIVTSRITHATPASFNAHVLWRDYENDIAEQQIGDLPQVGRTADLMLGGGRRHFVPAGHPESVREDTRDLLTEASASGVRVLTTRSDFDALDTLPALGVFTPDHMSYNIDRDPAVEPSLEEMAVKGLHLLHNASLADPHSPGFFAMIEGSRIDMAAHSNDPGTHAHEILHYYKVIAAVRKFVDDANARGEETVMVSTSDHETGGLALARQLSAKYPEYLWKPEVVARQSMSTVVLAKKLFTALSSSTSDRVAIVQSLVAKHLGVNDLSADEVAYLVDPVRLETELDLALATAISQRAQLGWSTHGHSGVDVNLYAHGAGAEHLHGNHENTDVGKFLQRYLGLESHVTALTMALRREIKFKHPQTPPEHDGPGLMSMESGHRRAFGHD